MCQQPRIHSEFHNFRVPVLWCKAHFYTQAACAALHRPAFSFGTISTCGNRACDAPPSPRMEALNHEEGTPTALDISSIPQTRDFTRSHARQPHILVHTHTPPHMETSVAG